ncbi:MAG: hypothetical protein PWQ60_1117 [Thermoanaerobacteraceae bacterium]|jgi:hypothetical protein|nr:hypothetical protein [Thermoanaerobacteraceae bacterium]MDN5311164.1 hypothetical protein [Thermoanaerobacteraceae bacterium]
MKGDTPSFLRLASEVIGGMSLIKKGGEGA